MTSLRLFLSLLLVMSSSAALAVPRRHAVAPPASCFSAILAEAATGTVVLDNDFVYYGDWSSRGVYRVAKTGGPPQLLAMFPCCVVTQMVADADHVYVAMRRHGDAIQAPNDKWLYNICAIAKTGGAVVTLAEGIWLPKQLAVDDRFVYWVSSGTVINDPHVASDGKIERINKDGTERAILASGLSGPDSVAVDDAFVYFTESGLGSGNSSRGARRVAKDGGSVQRLYNLPVDVVALNGADLYLLVGNTDTGKTTITQTAKNGGQVKRSFNDFLIINPIMTIFDGRLYYYTQTKNAFAVASVTLDLQDRRLHVERLFNGDQIGVDGCALYISTVAPADFEVERVVR
jgi:hypothetical protein